MRNVFYAVLLSVIMFSCQQDNPPDPNPPTNCTEPIATFKYKFNGTLVEMTGSLSQNSKEGSLIRKEQKSGVSGSELTNTNYLYSILATKNYYYSDDGEPFIEIEIDSPTLSQTTYNSASIHYVKTYYPQQGFFSSLVPPGTNFSVTITKIQNGYADGTFMGTIKSGSSSTFYQITEGEFKNVKILQ